MIREIFFFKNHDENVARRLVPDFFFFFFKRKKALYKVKESVLELCFTMFRQHSNQHSVKKNCTELQFIHPEIYYNCTELQFIHPDIYSTLMFQKRIWEQFFRHILCMIFQQKCFSCYILLTDQISLSDCLQFLRYQVICVLQLIVNQFVTS